MLFAEWSACQNQRLQYPNRDSWDRMLRQGIMLLDRFCQEDRVRVCQPRRNLQIKFTRPVGGNNEFVAYITPSGNSTAPTACLSGKRLRADTGGAGGPVVLGSAASLLFVDDWNCGGRRGRVRVPEPTPAIFESRLLGSDAPARNHAGRGLLGQ